MSRLSFERMSAHDAGYLRRETPEQPLHYVLQLDLERPIPLEELRGKVNEHLGRVPFLLRMPRTSLLGGTPVWVDDPRFSAERQVIAWREPLRRPSDVDAAYRELTTMLLARDRPMWRIVLGDGPTGRSTLWFVAHHSMMDGGLLATVLRQLFEGDADAAPAWRTRRAPSPAALVVPLVGRKLLGLLKRRARPSSTPGASSGRATTMTGPVGPTRALSSFAVPLEGLREARRRMDATINDICLAAVTEGLRDYLPDPPSAVVALVPRNVRRTEEEGKIGNRGWSMLVDLPTGEADADLRLRRIAEQTSAGKTLPSTAGTQGWRFDVAVTNVALGGPLAVAGRGVTGHRVSVPLQGENRLVVVVTSLGHDLVVSLTADEATYPDVERFSSATRAAMQTFLAGPAVKAG